MKDVAPVGHTEWSYVLSCAGVGRYLSHGNAYSLQLIPAESQKPGCTTPTMSE